MIVKIFLTAIALVFVIEGFLPFLSPKIWRRMMIHAVARKEQAIRLMGLMSLIIGMLLMVLVHSGIF